MTMMIMMMVVMMMVMMTTTMIHLRLILKRWLRWKCLNFKPAITILTRTAKISTLLTTPPPTTNNNEQKTTPTPPTTLTTTSPPPNIQRKTNTTPAAPPTTTVTSTSTTTTTTTDSTESATDSTNPTATSEVSPTVKLALDAFLKDIMKDTAGFAPPKKKNGAPRVVIVCQSAIRCVEVCRMLGDLKIGKIGKLFGKHKQQSQQAYFLKNTSFSCAIGTPSRIGKLVADGSLNLKHCCRCVFDATYEDSKQRTLFEQPDVRRDLLGLLREHLIKLVKASDGDMKLAIF
eukprot:m.127219 g.127219  ORF g.127219 m.127219 type:complete len:288 (+) comp29256_c2_seq2:1-864(+)